MITRITNRRALTTKDKIRTIYSNSHSLKINYELIIIYHHTFIFTIQEIKRPLKIVRLHASIYQYIFETWSFIIFSVYDSAFRTTVCTTHILQNIRNQLFTHVTLNANATGDNIRQFIIIFIQFITNENALNIYTSVPTILSYNLYSRVEWWIY